MYNNDGRDDHDTERNVGIHELIDPWVHLGVEVEVDPRSFSRRVTSEDVFGCGILGRAVCRIDFGRQLVQVEPHEH